MPCPPRRTVSLQTTCQVNPDSLKSLLVGATVIAMRLGTKTGVHCIQHGRRPLDVRLSGSISCCCCPLSWPLSPPQNSQSKKGGVYLTHLQSFSPESTPLTATHWGHVSGPHIALLGGRMVLPICSEERGGSWSIHVTCWWVPDVLRSPRS